MHETPLFLVFGRQPRLTVDITLGIHHVGRTADTAEFAQNRRNNLQIAVELARRNLTELADKHAEKKNKHQPYPGCSYLDRKYSCTDLIRIRIGPSRNCYYHGEDHMSSAHNYHQWCIEYDLRATPYRCQPTSPTQSPTINGRHHPHLSLRSWRNYFLGSLFPYRSWAIQRQLNPKSSPTS